MPPLVRDQSFGGILATQFLGAFNDNLFKQLVLLICVAEASRVSTAGGAVADPQGLATVLFAAPFVLFSGFAGFLSDRFGKRQIVVLSKVAEIVVMLLGVAAFILGSVRPDARLPMLFVVLFLMGLQSTFFGPAKYGILPELFRDRDLPGANGLIQMTTFLAIIFGAALAGFLKGWYGDALWIGMTYCVGIAVVGTLTSLLIRRTRPARAELKFDWSAFIVTKDVWRMLWHDRPLLGVLGISSVFWFLGGATQQAANYLGKEYFGWSDGRTSMLVATIGVGICIGCLVAAAQSRHRVDFRITLAGAWGLVLAFCWLGWLGISRADAALSPSSEAEPLWALLRPKSALEWEARTAMLAVGLSAGLFVVPLQVFMQARPPAEFKGRMIGAMNLVNWIGIVLSGIFYFAMTALLTALEVPFPALFLVMAACLLPIALLYHPQNQEL